MSSSCLVLRLLAYAVMAWGVLSAAVPAPIAAPPVSYDRGADLAADLRRADARNVLVVAHRSDWRWHPENSLPAIRSAIAMGVDIVEVDVRRTKDGRFVIIHDTTLDRTTTGRGKVGEMTLGDLQKLRLRDGAGSPTEERIPTLEEALEAVRGRALINVDKSADHPEETFRVVEKAGALGYTLFSVSDPLETFEAAHPGLLAQMPLFMLVVGERVPDKDALISRYLERRPPTVLQVVFSCEDDPALSLIARARARGVRVWMNALWPHHNAGHHDDRALQDPDGAYGWLVATGATVIQSDRPRLLMEYLHRTGWRR